MRLVYVIVKQWYKQILNNSIFKTKKEFPKIMHKQPLTYVID